MEYKKTFQSNLFTCMRITKQQYYDIMIMPIKRFNDFIKWNIDVEEEKNRKLTDLSNDI